MHRNLTIEQWRNQAIEWAEMDENEGIIEELKSLEKSQVIDYIAEFWGLEFSALSTPAEIYNRKKWQISQEAQEWQLSFEFNNYSYEEIAEKTAYFEKLGKRYGLIKEFKENGII